MKKEPIPIIPVTGGPCGGKTTILAGLVDEFISRNFHPYVIPEAATLLNQAGVRFDNNEFQKLVFTIQKNHEKIFSLAAQHSVGKPIIFSDRGLLDGLAYADRGIIEALSKPKSLEYIRDFNYKAILHLQTAAIDAEEFYTLANNTSRTEGLDKARSLDKALIDAWNGHPKHVTIANKGITFEEKKQLAIDAVLQIMGLPVPCEEEQRFLLSEDFRVEMIPESYVSTPIVQDYIIAQEGYDERVRRRGLNGSHVYSHTIKRAIPHSIAKIKNEELLSKVMYQRLLSKRDCTTRTIHKTRTTFHYESLYFELDSFHQPITRKILEVKKTLPGMKIILPPFIEQFVEREITGDSHYSNALIAKGNIF